MEIEKQVCSLELAKRLKELGVTQESIFWWGRVSGNSWSVYHLNKLQPKSISAFTVAELGEMLPEYVMRGGRRHTLRQQRAGSMRYVSYEYDALNVLIQNGTTEADARASILIYLLENSLIQN